MIQSSRPPDSGKLRSSSTPAKGSETSDSQPDAPVGSPAKPYYQRIVPAGMGPQPLTTAQKFDMSIRSRFGLQALFSSFFGAGERQLFNSCPHYGTDRGAFGDRLGAAETNQFVESFFSYGLYPSLFHEDAHYYVMGPTQGYRRRVVYAASRVVVTRKDSGRSGINWSKLAGLASAAAATNAYYPARDRKVSQTVSTYVTSIGTSALTLEIQEFLPDVLHLVFHRNATGVMH